MYQTVTLAKKSEKVANPWTRSLQVVHGTLPKPIPHPAYGIDPGVNFGLAVIEETRVFVFHGSLNRDDKPGRMALIAFRFLQSMLNSFEHRDARMTIEGAAYGAPFRQVELSEIRTGFYMAAALPGYGIANVEIKPPASIRKKVFGDGKIQAGDEFPSLNHNAADALSMALYAAQYTEV